MQADVFSGEKGMIRLNERECELLGWISTGADDDQIALELSLSSIAIKSDVENVFKKINIYNRLQAALWAAVNL